MNRTGHTKASQTMRTVDDLVNQWTAKSGPSQEFSATRDLLRFLMNELYGQYKPIAEKPPFWERLSIWIQNVKKTPDRQCLFNFVPWLLFVGQDELEAMFRAAMAGPIARWIIEEAQLDICDDDMPKRFAEEVSKTYFGSLAGFDIGSFLRINGISGQSHRVTFRDEAGVGDHTKFRDKTQQYVRFVAVEDMVGTGTQMLEAAPFLEKLTPKRVLICPLIIAPAGVKTWHEEIAPDSKYSHFSFAPLFAIPENATIPDPLPLSHPPELKPIHNIANQTWAAVQGSHGGSQLYGPFGYGDFGSLVLPYTNCPDNVPPMIHHESDKWHPLFPRISREA